MKILSSSILSLAVCCLTVVSAQEAPAVSQATKETFDYQSDVARMRQIVINSLYSHREIFLRELVSNANDAIEKLRLIALKDKSIYDGVSPLNVTIKAVKNENGKGGKLVVTDTGIGMTPEELKANLGTLAKSGTSEFLARSEGSESQLGGGNLIGAFGLGFYSSFLVADHVYVASVHAKSGEQHVFSSSADKGAFEIYPDPRGNTLGRGTEITLVLKEEAAEYLDYQTLMQLVTKHSIFSTTFPIYLWERKTEEVPVEPEVIEKESSDSDEATVEDAPESGADKTPKTKTVEVEDWVHINPQLPLWQRDPKNVTDIEYQLFYSSIFKDYKHPLVWHHFSGDSDGVSFKAIIYVPAILGEDFWKQEVAITRDVRLYVKRTFITTDLGEPGIRKWASWVKAIVDADDLPLNVSREMLQSNKFLKQLKALIMRRILQLFQRLATDDVDKFAEVHAVYGNAFKLGAIEDQVNQNKLIALTRFDTNLRNMTSLDQYVENMKTGQKQIYYLAEVGKSTVDLKKSVFIEKLNARGYEVLLFGQALDEILIQNMRSHKGLQFQDVAKKGLEFGDEAETPEEEKELEKELKEQFQPLIDYMKNETKSSLQDVVISTRLVTSPCAVVADSYGYTANIERMIALSNSGKQNALHDYAKKAKILEVNPKSPLIEGLLKRVNQLPTEEEGKDSEAEAEIQEVISILVDSALVRSGFPVTDSNLFFTRMDQVLRRSLQVSPSAAADATVRPAPPVDPKGAKKGATSENKKENEEAVKLDQTVGSEDTLHDEL